MRVVGQRMLRREDHRLLTSGGTYVADVADPLLDGALHISFVRSTLPHALLRSIDIDAAAAQPGVWAVFTAADLDITHMPPVLPRFDPALSLPLLARDRVRYVGEPVAAVVASSHVEAVDAAEHVVVEYEPQAPGALLFPERGTNVAGTLSVGDEIDGLFDGCDVVVHAQLTHPRVAACPIEGRSAASVWDVDGRLHHWISVQAPHAVKMALVTLFAVAPTSVRVIAPDVGGGFGPKFGNYPEDVVTAWAARRLTRPIRWTETRRENLLALHHGRAQRHAITLGGTRDGQLRAYHLDVEQDAGAYASLGVYVPEATVRMTTGVYAIPRAAATARAVLSATTPVSAFRGSGRPEGIGAIEHAVDLYASRIGIDPIELRRRNLLRREVFPHTTAVGAVYDSGDYARAVHDLVAAAGYDELRREQRARRARGDRQHMGIGVSVYVESTAAGPAMEFGTVTIHADGTATIATGSSPHGQGHSTTWAMLGSEQLGVPIETIAVVHGDTDVVAAGLGTYASRSTQLAGSAIYRACEAVIAEASEIAARHFEVAAVDIRFDAARACFHVAGTPAKSIGWATIAEESESGQLSETAMFTGAMTFPFGAHLAVVEVDGETGAACVVRLVAVDDAGTIINPLLAEGQLHGGIAQGISEALYETVVFDDAGNPLTTSFAEYGIVSAAELPSFELHTIETPTPLNPLGAKGIGESGTIGAVAAVRAAVNDAVGHPVDPPLTPERIWRALAGEGSVGG